MPETPNSINSLKGIQLKQNKQNNLDEISRKIVACISISSEESIPSMITIAGQWGSGKTTILKKIRENLQKNVSNSSTCVIFFDAWKHQTEKPELKLIDMIYDLVGEGEGEGLWSKYRPISDTAALPQMLSSLFREKYMKKINRIASFKSKRIVLLIDDLDRCDFKTASTLFFTINFLEHIVDCVPILAVDFDLWRKAWHDRYNTNDYSWNNSPQIIPELFSVVEPKNLNSIKKLRNIIHENLLFVNELKGTEQEIVQINDYSSQTIKKSIDKLEKLEKNKSFSESLTKEIDGIYLLFNKYFGNKIEFSSNTESLDNDLSIITKKVLEQKELGNIKLNSMEETMIEKILLRKEITPLKVEIGNAIQAILNFR